MIFQPGDRTNSVTSLQGSVLSVASSSRGSIGQISPRIPQSASLDAMPSSTQSQGRTINYKFTLNIFHIICKLAVSFFFL